MSPLANKDATEEDMLAMLNELTFDWKVIEKICASNIKKLDFLHEIWEFQAFPTEVEIKKMKMLR